MVGPKNNSLAVLLPQMGAYSESFIQMQIDALQPARILHGGIIPTVVTDTRNRETTPLPVPLSDPHDHAVVPGPAWQEALANWLQVQGIRVLLAQYGVCAATVTPACQRAGVQLVVHFHGFDASRRSVLDRYAAPYRDMFSVAQSVIAVSHPMFARLRQMGCPASKLYYNPYGVQDRFFGVQPSFQEPVFVTVGRFVEKKGPLLTLQAFIEVNKRFPRARLWMAGDGPLVEACRETVLTHGLDRAVLFPGILRHDMVPAFLSRGMAFVQHSLEAASGDAEGTPVAILEASAAGLPVVSTWHAGIPEAVKHGVSGLLVQEGDVAAMSDAMIRLLENPDLARRMGEAGRLHMQTNYTMRRYLDTLEALVAGRPAR